MPQKQEKVNTQPTPSLMQRLFGGVMSDSLAQQWPDLAKSWASREMQYPEMTSQTNRVFEMGPLMKWLNPDAYAVTGPLGTIAMNRGLIERDNQNIDDVLTHELAHVRQGKKGFLRNYYEPSKVEDEAINFEAMHSRPKPKDINLPVDTAPTSGKLQKLVRK